MSTQQENFKKIADKIREKTNTTAPIKPSDFATLIDDVYIKGQESGNASDTGFWDTYQDNGNRSDYKYAFYGSGWNDETFHPEHDIILPSDKASHENMFSYCGSLNLEEAMASKGLVFDTSNIKEFGPMFFDSGVTHLPEIDAQKATKFTDTFLAGNLESIKKLKLSPDGKQTFNAAFWCPKLKHVEIEGIIDTDFDSFQSGVLSKNSIYSIFSALSPDITTSKMFILIKNAVDEAFRGPGVLYLEEDPWLAESDEIVNGSDSYEWMMFTMEFQQTHGNWNIFLA